MRKPNAKHDPTSNAAGSHSGYMSPDERRAAGKALRDAAPRAAQGGWKPAKDRRDPIELLHESNESRIPELIPIRFGRMSQSPFAFYRGSAAVMAADLASTPASGLRVQACGDAHLMNFGGFATPERNIFFDINDFDETLPAPWEWDVKRLAASIVIAAHHIRLLDSEAAKAATEAVCSYREHMADYASMHALDVWYDRIDLDRVLKVLPDRPGGGAGQAKGRTGAAKKPAGQPVSQAGRALRLGAKDQGRAAADLPPHRRAGARRQVGIRRRARTLSEVAAGACQDAVRPLPPVRQR